MRARVVRLALALAMLAAALPVGFLLRPLVDSNLAAVVPGKLFRAAQPTSRLLRIIKENQLAAILNLRGGSARDWWYTAEVRTAGANGVAFFDFPMSATKRPSRRELLTLIDFFDHCPYPLLIHCKAGADRTGLATAMYLMMKEGEPPRQALRAFTLYHGHVPMFGPQHLHEPVDEYAAWLDAERLEHTPARLRAWVKDTYHSADPSVNPAPLPRGPRRALPYLE